MTVIIPLSRTLPRQFLVRQLPNVARWYTCEPATRVSSTCTRSRDVQTSANSHVKSSIRYVIARKYATASGTKAAGRPKAHTGRTAAKRTTRRTTANATAGKKKAAKKPRAKPKPKAKTRKVKKPASKTATKRAESTKLKDIKAAALLDEPKRLPATAWGVMFGESVKKGTPPTGIVSAVKTAAAKFKDLSPEDREHYNHLANNNKDKNVKAYQQWVASHTPLQIKEANVARQRLRALEKKKTKKSHKRYSAIKDDRLVTRPKTSYNIFYVDRYSTGDFKDLAVVEASKLIGREWKALSASEKKSYEDQASAEKNRYIAEHKTVYGEAPTTLKK